MTALLIEWRDQVEGAEQKLLPLVHDELRRIAKRHMAGKRPDHVLQATALVNEAYLRLVDVRQVQWQDRAHFFAMAARLMRRVPVDFARAQKNQKRAARFIASPSIRTCRLQARLTRTSSRSMRRCGRSR